MKQVIYVGKDPNFKNMKCTIEGRKGKTLIVSSGDEILGKVYFSGNVEDFRELKNLK